MIYFIFYLILQYSTSTSPIQNDCKHLEYSTLITKALNAKYSDNKEEANTMFKTAFLKVDTPLGKDLEEALELALELHDDKQAEYVLIKLIKGGVPIRYFQKFPLLKNQIWFQTIQKKEKEYTSYFKKHYNQKLRKELVKLRKRDSIFNVEFHQFRKGERYKRPEQFVEEVQKIHTDFVAMTKELGFPSEKNLGYWVRDNKIQFLPTFVILLHLHQCGSQIVLTDFSYNDLVCEGNLNPYNYDFIVNTLDYHSGIEENLTSFYNLYKHLY